MSLKEHCARMARYNQWMNETLYAHAAELTPEVLHEDRGAFFGSIFRTLNHLMFMGSYPIELGAITPIFYAFRERETLQQVMEELSGGRMHYMFNRVGGLKEDLPAGWLDRAEAAVGAVRSRMPQIEDLIYGNEIFKARTVGVGTLSPALIDQYGVSGPIARALLKDLAGGAPHAALTVHAQAALDRLAEKN